MGSKYGPYLLILFFLCNLHNLQGLLYTRVERPAGDIHFSLLGPFVSYKENANVLEIYHKKVWKNIVNMFCEYAVCWEPLTQQIVILPRTSLPIF